MTNQTTTKYEISVQDPFLGPVRVAISKKEFDRIYKSIESGDSGLSSVVERYNDTETYLIYSN